MPALHIDTEAISTINDRIRPSVGIIHAGETYWPRRILKMPHATVLPSLNGLARLIAADGNFLEDAHLGEQYSREVGFFGTAHMKARIIDAIGLLSLREAGIIRVAGFQPQTYLDGGLAGVFQLIEHVWKKPISITAVGAMRENDIDNDKLDALYRCMNTARDEIADLSMRNLHVLFDYANEYANNAVDYLSELLQKPDYEVWGSLGEVIAIEEGTHNLALIVDGGVLRQRPQLVLEAN